MKKTKYADSRVAGGEPPHHFGRFCVVPGANKYRVDEYALNTHTHTRVRRGDTLTCLPAVSAGHGAHLFARCDIRQVPPPRPSAAVPKPPQSEGPPLANGTENNLLTLLISSNCRRAQSVRNDTHAQSTHTNEARARAHNACARAQRTPVCAEQIIIMNSVTIINACERAFDISA